MYFVYWTYYFNFTYLENKKIVLIEILQLYSTILSIYDMILMGD